MRRSMNFAHQVSDVAWFMLKDKLLSVDDCYDWCYVDNGEIEQERETPKWIIRCIRRTSSSS